MCINNESNHDRPTRMIQNEYLEYSSNNEAIARKSAGWMKKKKKVKQSRNSANQDVASERMQQHQRAFY